MPPVRRRRRVVIAGALLAAVVVLAVGVAVSGGGGGNRERPVAAGGFPEGKFVIDGGGEAVGPAACAAACGSDPSGATTTTGATVPGGPVPTTGKPGGVTVPTTGTTVTTKPAPVTSVGATLSQGVVRPGGKLTFSAVGFKSGSAVRVELHSEPVYLTTLTAGSDGTVSSEVTIPATAPGGEHHLVASGTGEDGKPLERTAPLLLDVAAPVIVSVTASPTTVAPGGTVTFAARFTDDTGVSYAAMTIRRSGSDGTINWPCGYQATRTSGTAQDGTWTLTCTIPDVVNPGSYDVIPYGHDQLDNWAGMNQGALKTTFTIE